MTKYLDQQNYGIRKTDTPIPLEEGEYVSFDETKTYWCKSCNCKLSLQDDTTRELSAEPIIVQLDNSTNVEEQVQLGNSTNIQEEETFSPDAVDGIYGLVLLIESLCL